MPPPLPKKLTRSSLDRNRPSRHSNNQQQQQTEHARKNYKKPFQPNIPDDKKHS